MQQARLNSLLGSGVATLAHAGTLADAVAQVVELGPSHIAAGGHLDALDLGGVHGEHALDPYAKRLLAHREGLASSMALTLDDHTLEHLDTATGTLDDLEVDAHAIAWPEVGDAAQLLALNAFDDCAH